jgi:hypothetical protein
MHELLSLLSWAIIGLLWLTPAQPAGVQEGSAALLSAIATRLVLELFPPHETIYRAGHAPTAMCVAVPSAIVAVVAVAAA